MRRHVTIADLPEQPDHGVILKCPSPTCGLEFSATRGDYFIASPLTTMRCGCQGRPFLQLVKKTISYEYVPITKVPARMRETERSE